MKTNINITKTETPILLTKNNSVSLLMARARLAKSRFRIAEAENGVKTLSAFELLHFKDTIHNALENNEFSLWYQPKIDLCHGHVVGAESLIRWAHPSLGFVPAAKIISLLEDFDLMMPFTEWAIREVKNMQSAWQEKGLPPLRTAINISSKQFLKQQLPKVISEIFDDSSLDLTLLEIELSGSALVQQGDKALDCLKQLETLGISISIDDFGTGSSSLKYFKKYPIDTIKIDRFFIKDLQESSPEISIIKAISTFARHMGMKIGVEGIETLDQYRILRDLGCDIGQGFLLSQALPIEDLEILIQTNQSFIPNLELPMATAY